MDPLNVGEGGGEANTIGEGATTSVEDRVYRGSATGAGIRRGHEEEFRDSSQTGTADDEVNKTYETKKYSATTKERTPTEAGYGSQG